jgi:hypothetical protein
LHNGLQPLAGVDGFGMLRAVDLFTNGQSALIQEGCFPGLPLYLSQGCELLQCPRGVRVLFEQALLPNGQRPLNQGLCLRTLSLVTGDRR